MTKTEYKQTTEILLKVALNTLTLTPKHGPFTLWWSIALDFQ
jgi:hypothetical protein